MQREKRAEKKILLAFLLVQCSMREVKGKSSKIEFAMSFSPHCVKIVLINGHRPFFRAEWCKDPVTYHHLLPGCVPSIAQPKRASAGRWHIFHLPRQNGPASGTRRADESDTCEGDSFSHLGIMVLIGVLLVSLLWTGRRPKMCDNIHN